MNRVILRESAFWGRSSVIILAGGYGFVMVSVLDSARDVAVVHDIIVHESRRRKGIGNRLLKEAGDEAERLGADRIRLSVEPESWMADWYRRHGFMLTDVTELDSHLCLVMERRTRRDAPEPQIL